MEQSPLSPLDQVEEIEKILAEDEVDLWALRELCLSEGGLVNGMFCDHSFIVPKSKICFLFILLIISIFDPLHLCERLFKTRSMANASRDRYHS